MANKKKSYKKRGLSGIITVVILIAIVLVAGGVVWNIVNNLVDDKLNEASSCFEIFEKISFNREWICYNLSSKEILVSLARKDVELERVDITINSGDSFQTFEIPGNNSYTKPYKGDYSENILLPGKNSGKTYVVNLSGAGFYQNPVSMIAYSVVNKKQCQASDKITEIPDCSSFDFS
jgi:flagellin-like protein